MYKPDYREKAFNLMDKVCKACGSTERWNLVVHHKDGDRENDDIENLIILCNKCHGRIHTSCPGYEKWTKQLPEDSLYGIEPKSNQNMLKQRKAEVEDRDVNKNSESTDEQIGQQTEKKASKSTSFVVENPDVYRKEVPVDNRGRVSVGREHAGKTVTVVVEIENND